MSLDAAMADLDRLVVSLDAAGAAADRAAVRAAPLVLEVLRIGWAAGEDPNGAAWAPRFRDGAVCFPALGNLATARADGPAVIVEVPVWAAVHQASPFPLMPTRKILPDPDTLPEPIREVLETALAAEMEAL